MNTEFDKLLQDDAPPFVAALGLLSEPFADTASGHFYYSDADSDQRLDLMLHLARRIIRESLNLQRKCRSEAVSRAVTARLQGCRNAGNQRRHAEMAKIRTSLRFFTPL